MVIYNLLLQFRLDRRLHFEQRLWGSHPSARLFYTV